MVGDIMKNKKYLIISIVGIILVVVGGVILFLPGSSNINKKMKAKYASLTFEEDMNINFCVDSNNCPIPGAGVYKKIKYDTNVDEIKEKIDSINKDTEKYYEKSNNSDAKECDAEMQQYIKKSYYVTSLFDIYSDEEIVSFTVTRSEIDYCNEEKNKVLPLVSYTYDLKEGKFLNNEDIMKRENISQDEINHAIQGSIFSYNDAMDTNLDYDDVAKTGEYAYKLMYDPLGNLAVSYYHPDLGLYYTATIIDKSFAKNKD